MTRSTRSPLRGLVAPTVCTLIAGAILIGLGVWQLHRLTWKEALLARIESRTKAAPRALPPASTWANLKPADYEYDHVAVTGTFDHAAETLILRASADGPGYHVITPLKLDGGGAILIDRGFVPSDLKDPSLREAGQVAGAVRITGVLRAPESRNLFTPPDEPTKGVFYTRDPALIAAHDGLSVAAPFSIDADPSMANPGGWPKSVSAEVAIPNNHLSYALTWFGLALGLFAVFLRFAWSRFAANEVGPDREISKRPALARRHTMISL